MSVSTAIRAKLVATAAVTNEVSTRVFAQAVPEKVTTFPCVAYDVEDQKNVPHYGGATDLIQARGTIAVIGETYEQMEDAAEAVRDAVDGMNGTWDGHTVYGFWVESARDTTDRDASRGVTFHIRELRYLMWVK